MAATYVFVVSVSGEDLDAERGAMSLQGDVLTAAEERDSDVDVHVTDPIRVTQ